MGKGGAKHMYGRRPRQDSRTQGILDEVEHLETIRGRCSLVDQEVLVFGYSAKIPRDNRPAVILKADGRRILVVPGTSSRQSDCFLLNRGHCPQPRASQALGLARETYLASIIEVIPSDALGSWLCDLNDLTRQRLFNWLQKRISGEQLAVDQRRSDVFRA
jgi:hypothetical protein